MNNYIVYKHIFPNNKIYIGITCQKSYKRWKYGSGYIGSPYIYKAIKKYGWNNIKHEILFSNLTKEEACQKEIELIAKYKSNNSQYGYNISSGGAGSNKHKLNEETKRLIGKKSKEMWQNKEIRKKIVNSMKKRTMSEETKRKIGNFHKGRKRKKETCEKISLALKGRTFTEEQKKHMSDAQKGKKSKFKGIKKGPLSEEVKRKISMSNKGRKLSKEQIEKLKKIKKNTSSGACICKKVICIETNEKFLSTTQASEKTGVQRYKISEMCNNKKKHEKCSLHFRFEED